eukprot:11999755-Heterocapsa_arctica.AAC.1
MEGRDGPAPRGPARIVEVGVPKPCGEMTGLAGRGAVVLCRDDGASAGGKIGILPRGDVASCRVGCLCEPGGE